MLQAFFLLGFAGCDEESTDGGCRSGLTSCDGFCVNLDTHPSHCGSCGNECPERPNSVADCAGGLCTFECFFNYVDLDGFPENGCEYECTTRSPVEVCNGEDDDCDGIIDNGAGSDGTPWDCIRDEWLPCDLTCLGRTIEGTQQCPDTCLVSDITVCWPPEEACNGLDDNCDGIVDNGTTDATPWDCSPGDIVACRTPCDGTGPPTGLGLCPGTCLIAQATECFETCNGCDDDNDTVIDDGMTDDVPWDCAMGDEVDCPYDCSGVEITGTGTCPETCFAADAVDCTPREEEELCDGRDDNCNGEIDEELFGRLFVESKVSDNPGDELGRVDVVWTGTDFGSRYFMAWDQTVPDDREVHYNWADSAGTIDLANIGVLPVTEAPHGERSQPVIAWNGSLLGAAWIEDVGTSPETQLKLHCVTADESGQAQVTANLAVDGSDAQEADPDMEALGDDFALAWVSLDAGGQAVKAALLSDGASVTAGPVEASISTSAKAMPRLAWSGSRIMAVWSEDYNSSGNWELFASVMLPDGTMEHSGLRVFSFLQNVVTHALVWDGLHFAALVEGSYSGSNTIFLVVMDSAGEILGTPVEILTASISDTAADMAWDGTYLALTWHEGGASSGRIFFSRFHAGDLIDDYAPAQSAMQVTTVPGSSTRPALAWSGSGYGVAFRNDRSDTLPEAYFVVLGCP